MQIRFYCSPETGLPHCLDHGVSEREVAEVFENAPTKLHGSSGALFALGQCFAGRYLKIIYRLVDDGTTIFVITAYDLKGKALQAYKRRRRRRGDR